MNTTANGPSSMGHSSAMAHGNNSTGYSADHWTMSPYSQSPYSTSPMTDFGSFGTYMHHGLPSDLHRMPPPTQSQTHHQLIQPAPPMGHHQLPMLNTQWPSQLTNPTHSGSYSAPPLSMPPTGSLSSLEPLRLPIQHEKARKTLSAEQKRAMCQFHEENPGTRQADIGARFGVERSTVSKVLRHKEQYLKREPEPDNAAAKRGKGKNPDFDRTLSNYVRRQQQRGFEVKDDEIMEQARMFARVSGNQDGLTGALTGSWLLKFKQKHGIGAGKLMRRASETNIPDSITMPATLQTNFSSDQHSTIVSPISPSRQYSPLSGSRSDDELHGEGLGFEFSYEQSESHSSSLAGDLRGAGASFSNETLSPAPFQFSPDANIGAFPLEQNNTHLASDASDFHHREKRSNTFPSINADYANQHSSQEPLTPRHASTTATSSSMESPAEAQSSPFEVDKASPHLRRSSSSLSIATRSNNTSTTGSALSSTADSSPVSPTQEDARRAATTLLTYLQSMNSHGQFEQSEYATLLQLTRKLQIHQHQNTRPSIGGLSRIPEGDAELQASNESAIAAR